ncbi:hypothetical protein Q5P01_020966 [Channa striata]|uniref:Uncharacterized protein n=1 Tax=Channa striata TaxID=64152 RepID=A0AA88LYD5_CHASR|nr:hypothetical protein Q5P01_020966 [Channa striata]
MEMRPIRICQSSASYSDPDSAEVSFLSLKHYRRAGNHPAELYFYCWTGLAAAPLQMELWLLQKAETKHTLPTLPINLPWVISLQAASLSKP